MRSSASGGMATRRMGGPLLALLCLSAATTARAQQPGATVRVAVSSADSGAPLAGAVVEVAGIAVGLTGADGRLLLQRIIGGSDIRIHAFGHASQSRTVALDPGADVELRFELRPAPLPLPPLRVRAEPGPSSGAALGFHRRREMGIGSFITRDDIERHRPRRFSDLLRMVPGVRLTCDTFSGTCELGMRSAPASLSNDLRVSRTSGAENSCPVQYYVDGIFQPYDDINALRPDDIEAVEVYAHGHQAPARYSVRKNARCGVVLVWMRATLRSAPRR